MLFYIISLFAKNQKYSENNIEAMFILFLNAKVTE